MSGNFNYRAVQSALSFETILVTPTIAMEFMEVNANNRNRNRAAVEKYKTDLRHGRWLLNGETIKFDLDGNLVDGQHRLTAIIETGIAAQLSVAWGVDRAAVKTIDRGKTRSIGDSFKLSGIENSTLVAGIAGWLWRWQRRKDAPKKGVIGMTTSQAEVLLRQHPDLIQSAHFTCGRKRKLIGLCAPSMFGFAHYIFSQIDSEDADVFLDMLAKGTDLSADHPVFRARERLRMMTAARQKAPDYDLLATIILAWNKYRTGKTLHGKSPLYWWENRQRFPQPQ